MGSLDSLSSVALPECIPSPVDAEDTRRMHLQSAFSAAIIESSDDAIVGKTLDGIVLTWNPGAERLFGYTAEEMVGTPIVRLFPPSRLAEQTELISQVASGKSISHFETQRIHKDGSEISVSVTLSPVRDASGTVVAVSKIARTIPEAYQCQHTTDLYRAVFEHSSDAIITRTLDGTVIHWNEGAQHIFGYSAAQMIGAPITRLFPADRLDEEPKLTRQLLAGRTISHFETQRLRNDGALLTVSMSLSTVRDPTGRIVAITAISRDVTGSHLEKLNSHRLASIVEHSDDAVISKRLDGTVISWNKSAERIFGYSADEMLGRSITRLFPIDRLYEEAELIAQLVAGNAISHFETQRVRKDGSHVSISATLSPVRDTHGKIVAVSKIARDISAWKRMNDQLQQVTADLKTIVDHSPGLISYWNGDYTNRFANRAYAEAFGLTTDEIRGRHVREVLGPELYALSSPYIEAARRGTPQSYERVTRLPNGTVRYHQLDYVPDTAAGGGSSGLFVFVNDVSHRKAAEQALAESAARFQQLYESTPAMMHSIDSRGRLLSVSEHWLQKLGFDRQEVLGRPLVEFLAPGSRKKFYTEHLAAFHEGRNSVTLDYQMVCKAGKLIDVVLSAIAERDADGQFVKGMAVIEDVTARRAAEEALKASEAFLARAGAVAGVGGFRVNLHTGEQSWTRQTFRIHDLPEPHAPTLQQLDALFSVETRTRLQQAVKVAASCGEGYDIEVPMLTAAGRPAWVRVVGEVEFHDGQPAFVSGAIQDVTERKAAEEALRTSQMFLDRAGNIAGVGAWALDLATGAVYWSNETCRIHDLRAGYLPSVDEALTYYPGASRTALDAAIQACVSDGTPYDLELDFISAAGVHKWVRAIGESELEFGRPVRLFGALQDITVRKKSEEALLTANERLRLATDAAAIGIWEFDVSTGDIRCDTEMCRIYGRPDGSMNTFDQWAKMLHPEDGAETQQAVQRALNGEREYDCEFRICRPSGEIRHIQAAGRVQRNALGAPVLMIGINYDITDRKQAEIGLKDTSSLLQSVLDSATDLSIIATTPELNIKVFNKGAENLLGYVSGELIDRATSLAIHDVSEVNTRAAELSAILGKPIVGGEVFTEATTLHIPRDWTYVRKDHQRVPVSLICSAMRGEDGALTGYLGVARDITQAREQESALKDATAKAEQANAAKSQFLANMSHEIRTPLNAIIGLGYLLEQTYLSEEQRSFLSKIEFAGRSLLSVINNVLDLSKIEAGEMVLEEAGFDVVNLAQQVGQMLMPQAQAKGVDLIVRPSSTMPRLLSGDATRLRQILTNLLNNAIKFTEHGHVELTLECLQHTSAGIRLRCAVKDTGIGISPEGVARLFTPFAQADASTTRRFGGTGLGLSIARRFAELMGGEIGVTSTVAVGSEFWVEMPLRIAEETDVDLLGQGKRSLRILIVESHDCAQSLQAIVRPLGWLPQSVGSADEAVASLSAGSGTTNQWPDVIIVDSTLKTVHPLRFISRLRSEFSNTELPPVIVVDNELESYRQFEPLQQAASVVLPRPVGSSSLFNAVNSAMAMREGDRYSALQATNFDQVSALWLAGAQILVVDDSEVNRVVAHHILQKQGATVAMCSDGAEAVEHLRKNPELFDVVLMDVQMPELDGNEATVRIRNELNLKTLPVIALTAGALVSERDRAFEAGMNDFLSKPLEPTALIRVVRRFVEIKRGAPLPVGILDKDKHQANVATGLASIDAKVVQQAFGNDSELFTHLLSRVLREFGEFALPIAVKLPDQAARKRMTSTLHKLRGSAGVIGAKAVQRLAGAAERAVEEEQPPEFIEAILRQLAAAFTALEEEVRPLLNSVTKKRVAAGGDAVLPAAPSDIHVEELLALLDDSNLDAIDQFEAIGPSVAATMGDARFSRLTDAMEELDFCLAASLLRQ